MQQVIAIHGGHVFDTYEEYFENLTRKRIDSIEYFTRHGWKPSLQEELGENYHVVLPKMPCTENVRYVEWKIWFEKLVPFLKDGVVLVGHSLGGKFLAKFLSEEKFPVRITATILVAAPFERGAREHTKFFLSESLSLLEKQGGRIFLYHSTDDPVVPFSELAKYQAALPHATTRIFEDRQHFNQETFPELVADIKSL